MGQVPLGVLRWVMGISALACIIGGVAVVADGDWGGGLVLIGGALLLVLILVAVEYADLKAAQAERGWDRRR